MGRSRGGLASKIHAVVDINGLPVRLAVTAGEAHDNRLAGKLLSRLKPGTMLLADRGYDADWIKVLAAERGVWAKRRYPIKTPRQDVGQSTPTKNSSAPRRSQFDWKSDIVLHYFFFAH
jgi:transposase